MDKQRTDHHDEKRPGDEHLTLPTHHLPPDPASQSRPHRKLAFAKHTRQEEKTRFSLRSLWKKLTDASTGSPSDGLSAGGQSEGSASVAAFLSTQGPGVDENGEWEVDEVVVEREERDPERERRPNETAGSVTHTVPSATDGSPREPEMGDEVRSRYSEKRQSWLRVSLSALKAFFDPCFDDSHAEAEFRKQSWYSSKTLVFFACVYLYLNFVLYLVFNHSITMYEKMVYYVGLTIVTVPLAFLIYSNWPQKYPRIFQITLVVATWYCAYSEVVQIKQCGFYSINKEHCMGKDFLAMLFYSTGFPTLVMFSAGGRLYHCVAQVIFLGLLCGLVLPDQTIFARNIVSFILYSVFIQYLHWTKEKVERRMFKLNSQLKGAYRSQQKAQIAESSANQAKRRFVHYLFHEVRVPLNTAMLAFQNLQVDGAFKASGSGHQALEIYALDSSLSMMQQVLNDALDLQRMDAGRFENSNEPFNLHRAITSMMRTARVATDAKKLGLVVELDPKIDELSQEEAEEGLYVVGDAVRLRQIVTNFLSNAVKFTKEGDIKVVTRMLETVAPPDTMSSPCFPSPRFPSPDVPSMASHEQSNWSETVVDVKADGNTHHNHSAGDRFLTFRLEVHDNGPGIKPSDLAGSRLFRPFTQTRVGRASGEGSGLGLAIVRQIVSLSDGRLGITSKKGKGACFWFELSYRIATMDEVKIAKAAGAPGPTSPSVDSVANPLLGTPPPNNGYIALPSPMSSLAAPSLLTPATDFSGHSPLDISEVPLTALVVDDDPLTRALFTRMLEKMGVVVETAEDGQEFIDIVCGKPPDKHGRSFDLICLDNSMPICNGEDAVRELRERGRTEYVVGCTGNALTDQQEAYLKAGADRVMAKPLLLRDVKEIVAVAAERRAEARKRLFRS